MDSHDFPNDLDAFWMPFTANRRFKRDPRMIVGAEGMYYTTSDGRKILDGCAGLWCVNAGHGRAEIVAAIQAQAGRLDYSPNYNVGHPGAFELAARLADLMPGDLDHVFFANSGSEAVDTALKIALAYHHAKGETRRKRLVGRARAFHGSGFGGLSVGGIAANRSQFGGLLGEVDHLSHTHDLERNAFSRGQPEHGAERADDLERLVQLHGGDAIAAVIVEPMAGAGGMLVPPTGYLERLRKICDAHGIVLIFDEVITAFGRLGRASAAEKFGVLPDLMVIAKGLTNAAVPMGAVMVGRAIHDAIMARPEGSVELFHGYTYSGHPLASAAALATLDLYRRDDLFARAESLSGHWEDAVHSLRGLPHVIDIRNIGLTAAIELAPRTGAPGERGHETFARCFDAGALVRGMGDIIGLSPPLIISPSEIDRLIEIIAGILVSLE